MVDVIVAGEASGVTKRGSGASFASELQGACQPHRQGKYVGGSALSSIFPAPAAAVRKMQLPARPGDWHHLLSASPLIFCFGL